MKLATISKNTTKTQTREHSCVRGLQSFLPPCCLPSLPMQQSPMAKPCMAPTHLTNPWKQGSLLLTLPMVLSDNSCKGASSPTQTQHILCHACLVQLYKQPPAKCWHCNHGVGTLFLDDPQPVSLHGLLHGAGNGPGRLPQQPRMLITIAHYNLWGLKTGTWLQALQL